MRRNFAGWLLLLCALQAPAALAADLYQDDGWDVRWDNTFRYTAGFRLSHYDEAVVADPNADDGDRNFAPGLISDRLDWLSEFDLSKGPFGIDVSATAWYDTVYHNTNSNDSPPTFNPFSVPHNHFTRSTEELMGEDADLLNAFGYGSFDAGDWPVSFRIGRHTLLWGESLFFANNGIAAGQAPIDAIKAASEPEAEAKEVYLPVGQASLTIEPRSNLSFSFYDQFEWRRTRLPASGSYFNDADFLDAGGERIIVGPDQYLYRTPDEGRSAWGQYGAAMHVLLDDIDYGFYALRFNAKEPEILTFSLPVVPPGAEQVGDYWLVFPRGIQAYGASFSAPLGDDTVAGEVSVRRNMPLISQSLFAVAGSSGGGGYGGFSYAPVRAPGSVTPPPQPSFDVLSYAVGDTLQGQLSTVSVLSPGPLWQGADLSAEIAANDRLNVTSGIAELSPGRDRFAAALRSVLEPHYYEVLPQLDVSLPIGLGYNLIGKSSVDSSMNDGAGDFELGVSATYQTVWEGSITFTHYFGPPDRQPFADRDFIALSVERTF
ncbi:MAG TPA: DUF1302 family protein [Rhizomicrobium sp.]|jgi:hypothetical protein|nr:DUF1302 family protein [Rhizomicrobium sp.]